MAISRFSEIFEPSEYVQPFDLGIFASLISQRQNKFDQNVNLAENQLSKYTNLPLLKDSQKEYANNKVRMATEQINSFGAVDYSDSNVTRQIQGVIGNIGKDENILNYLEWSTAFQNNTKQLELAKKNKTYAIQNAHPILQNQKDWLNDPNPDAPYTSVNYEDFVSWSEPTMKNLKEMKANQTIITGDIDPLDPNRQMLRKYSLEEVTPERVGKAIYHSLTPEQKRQFQIDAQFESRGMDNNGYLEQLTKLKTNQISELQDNIARIEKQKIIAQNNNQDTKPFDDYITSATSEIDIITNQLKSSEGMAKESLESADYLKLYKYQNQMADSYKNIFAYKKVSETGTVVGGDKNSDGTSKKDDDKSKFPLNDDGSIDYGRVMHVVQPDKDGSQSMINTKTELLNHGKQLNDQMLASKQNAYSNMNTDPNFQRLSPAEKDLKFKEYEDKWIRLDTKGIPLPVLNYFNETNEIRETQRLNSQLMLENETKLQAMPDYKNAKKGMELSTKTLKPSYELTIFTGGHQHSDFNQQPTDKIKKTYTKEDINNYIEAVIKTGQDPFPPNSASGVMGIIPGVSGLAHLYDGFKSTFMSSLDFNEQLPRTSSNSALIDDMNELLTKAKNETAAYHKEHPIKNTILGGLSFSSATEIYNPLTTSNLTPELLEHFKNYQAHNKVVNQLEDKVYSESGVELLIPTMTFSADKPTQDQIINHVKMLNREAGEYKDKDVKSVSAIKSRLDGNLEVSYELDMGGSSSPKMVTTIVPRTMAGTFDKMFPQDNERFLMEVLRRNGQTTDDHRKALRFIVGDESVPYRIVKVDGKLKVQFFDANYMPVVNWSSPAFDDIRQLKKAGQKIANDLLLKQKQQQTN
jgi:hypothetical protein